MLSPSAPHGTAPRTVNIWCTAVGSKDSLSLMPGASLGYLWNISRIKWIIYICKWCVYIYIYTRSTNCVYNYIYIWDMIVNIYNHIYVKYIMFNILYILIYINIDIWWSQECSMDWFMGKLYEKPWFLAPNWGASCRFSLQSILEYIIKQTYWRQSITYINILHIHK